ncbi:class I SAM-dependent methyltransferase [Methanoplanus endosymbiosus]|uniref:Class I SAM-dependent methyltransferase n=1 Tax=Methanoplanus endosymbiosus TaxID=33865 RepID=A0A9E7PL27_9EURY|nr:class I SAM-dependent methyltransferase [Methanoplanus endosymbiosus]UUX91292.1 class I SAM-dependent methyltransferase [Methanoplanus endosymbiosus]
MKRLIDYNELWKLSVSRRPSFFEDETDPGSAWDKRADNYVESSEGNYSNTLRELSLLNLSPDDTVLDVGAGTGRLTVPVAERVSFVTAVDPSARMLYYLRQNMIKAGLKNARCVQKRWEDVCLKKDFDLHDVVISAYSMGYYDAEWALDKLSRASRRDVHIFWFAGEQIKERIRAYIAEEKGVRYIRKPHYPDYICLLNVLHDMGIYADVKLIENEWVYKYNSIEEAVSSAVVNRIISGDEKIYAKKYYSDLLEESSGSYYLKETTKQALISWRK